MGRTDWDRILSIDPSSLTDDDMEDVYPAVISCDVDEISDVHNLRTLMKLSQEILQFKDSQVKIIILLFFFIQITIIGHCCCYRQGCRLIKDNVLSVSSMPEYLLFEYYCLLLMG